MAEYELVPKTYNVSCTVQIIGVNFVIEALSNAPNKITKLKSACTLCICLVTLKLCSKSLVQSTLDFSEWTN